MKDIIQGEGTGEFHVGWKEPGRKVCLGVGPVLFRLTVEEAAVLVVGVRDLLQEPFQLTADGGYDYTPCGCDGSVDVPEEGLPSLPVPDFWNDAAWRHDHG